MDELFFVKEKFLLKIKINIRNLNFCHKTKLDITILLLTNRLINLKFILFTVVGPLITDFFSAPYRTVSINVTVPVGWGRDPIFSLISRF